VGPRECHQRFLLLTVRQDGAVDINSVADELYSLPPEEFTATRTVSETEAKAIGDKQLAAAIHQLRKPSMGAWLANQLVREHPGEVQSFVDLGAALREATAMLSGDQLRELDRQRRQLVYALMRQARGLANAAGHKVSQDTASRLEDTLHAALADERAAAQLRAGRLTDTLQGQGFPSTEATTSIEPTIDLPSARSPKDKSAEQRRVDQLGRAERDEQLARAAVRDAADGLERAQTSVERAKAATQGAALLVNGLRTKLDKAEVEASRREQEHQSAQAELVRADRTGQVAGDRLDEAVQRLERLSH
jgi:pimeloyl-ACP methyl ester carboxylesterase